MAIQPQARPFKRRRHEQRMPEYEHDAYKQPRKVSACQDGLVLSYSPDEYLVRVDWKR